MLNRIGDYDSNPNESRKDDTKSTPITTNIRQISNENTTRNDTAQNIEQQIEQCSLC